MNHLIRLNKNVESKANRSQKFKNFLSQPPFFIFFEEFEVHKFIVLQSSWVHNQQFVHFCEFGTFMRMSVNPHSQLFFQKVLVQKCATSFYCLFWEQFPSILGSFTLLGTDMSQENELVGRFAGFNAFRLRPFLCSLILVTIGKSKPIYLSINISRYRSSETHNVQPFCQFHPFIVDVIKIIIVGLPIEKLFAIVVARDEEHLALEDSFQCGMNFQGLLHHGFLIMSILIMVAVCCISSNQTIIKASLAVVVLVYPGTQLQQSLFVQVDVGHKCDFQPVDFLQHEF